MQKEDKKRQFSVRVACWEYRCGDCEGVGCRCDCHDVYIPSIYEEYEEDEKTTKKVPLE